MNCSQIFLVENNKNLAMAYDKITGELYNEMIIEGFSFKFINVFINKYIFNNTVKEIMSNNLVTILAKDDF